jgi:hypothetical protein
MAGFHQEYYVDASVGDHEPDTCLVLAKLEVCDLCAVMRRNEA